MKSRVAWLVAGAALAASAFVAQAASAAEKIIIGHFGNPTPMQVAIAQKKFAEATGWDIEWRKFNAGPEVISAMAAGDVKISELGSSPLAIAASQGVDLQLFMFAQVIGTAESLIVRNGSGIEKLEDLKGKRVAVPVGSTSHFSLMGAIKHAGLADKDVTVIGMPPDQIAAAWSQGAIDAAFIWEPVQSEILKTGKLLVGGDKTAEWGFPTFDGWVVDKKFAQSHPAELAKFARVMNEANAAYLSDPAAWTAQSENVKILAKRTGAAPDQVPAILKGYTFLPLSEQLTSKWLGSAPATMKSTAEFLKHAGRIDTVAADYSGFVNADIAKAATSK